MSLRVTTLAASAQLGGTERVLLDFAAHAFEHDIALRVLTPRTGPLIDILNQIGVPADVVPAPAAMLRGSQQPGRLWSAVPAATTLPVWARALRAHRFSREANVLYSIGFKTHLATTFPLGRRVAWHLHEFPPQTTGTAWRWLARRIPDMLIANSSAVAKAWNPGAVVVPNGVDLDRFRPRQRTGWLHRDLSLPPGARLVGMPAVFARWKGQETVLQAFRSIAAEFPDVHLVFIGGSIYDTVAERQFGGDLVRLIADPAARAHILPFQSKVELVYPELDIAVHYSLRPEPFGRVILEAMACGVPVLAAKEGGPLEILGAEPQARRSPVTVAGSGGWLVPPRDPAALAGALRQALVAPAPTRESIGLAGRARAEDTFSARRFARGIAEALKKAAGR